ncbi:MAG: Lactate dehydrogenase related enzyme, partial [Microgenomates group bacterium GW2011_GWA2_44_7]
LPNKVMALKNGTIAGAALDVYATEPLPVQSELLMLPNVILTPHVAADSREGENRASLMVAKDVDRVLQGKKPKNSV